MDPTSIIAVATFAQSLAGIGSDAPDPSRVAIFETYQAVLVLNERVDEISKLLVEVRMDQIDLPTEIDGKIRTGEARVAERMLISYMDAIFNSHLQMLDNIVAGQDYDVVSSRFRAELVRHNIDFDTNLGILIRAATYELPTVLAAIEMAQVIDAADGSAPQAIKNRALTSIEAVEARLAVALSPELEFYRAQVEALKAELNTVVGEDWWTTGGRRLDRNLSYFDNSGTNVFCWPINTIVTGETLTQAYYELPLDQPIWYVIQNPKAIAEEDWFFCGERFSVGGFNGKLQPSDHIQTPRGPLPFKHSKYPGVTWNGEGYQRRDQARDIIDRLNVATLGYDIVLSYQKAVTEGVERLRAKVLAGDIGATRDYFTELTELAALGAPEASTAVMKLAEQQRMSADLAKANLARNWTQASLAASKRIDDGVARLRMALADYEKAANSELAKVVTILTLMQQFINAAEAVDEIVVAAGAGADRVTVSGENGDSAAADGVEAAASEPNRQPTVAGEAGTDGKVVAAEPSAEGPPEDFKYVDRNFVAANPDFRTGNPRADLKIVLMRLEMMALPTTDPLTTEVTEVEKLIAEGLALNLEPGSRTDSARLGPVASLAVYAAANRLGELAVGSTTAWLPGRVALEITKVSEIGKSSEWTLRDDYIRDRAILGGHFERVLNWRLPPEKRQFLLPRVDVGPTMRAAN